MIAKANRRIVGRFILGVSWLTELLAFESFINGNQPLPVMLRETLGTFLLRASRGQAIS
jgi:hypothetical protein